ncbi:hypothetical protein AKJ63_01895 [candidate division MSBL1 archaeon SCGC-AAA259D18]|uniref:KaiC domain-containing protein n=1 Tax=candidate division MSBL1 archaeon SCGC-AAA259D18 TaxID=1698262 RepID=A0A133UAC2_9EURY|nr:hypothetical protein AKJ63_01895 [candidate division MSBL1 archaeon SCGC-AAA259D18]
MKGPDPGGLQMRVKTGIPNFKKLVGGGIPRGNTVLLTGDYGTGKTTFGIQYLIKGVDIFNELGIFVTFEDDRESLIKYAKEFGWPIETQEKEDNLLILGGSPGRVEGFSKIAKKTGEGLIEEILKIVNEFDAKRLVIDGLDELSCLFKNKRKFKSEIAKLRRKLGSRGCTSILTSRPELGIEGIVDGIITLHYDGQIEKTRAIEIKKMRRTDHTDRMCPFEITDKAIKVTGYPEN